MRGVAVLSGALISIGSLVAPSFDPANSSNTDAAKVIDEALSMGVPVERVAEVDAVVRKDANGILEGTFDGFSIAELQDLSAVADQQHISGTVAIDRRNHEVSFTQIYTEAAKSDAFTGGRIVSGGRSWIGFAGTAPSEVRDQAQREGVEVREGLRFTRSDLERFQADIHGISDRVGGGDTASWVDEESLVIHVSTSGSPTKVQEAVKDYAATQAASARISSANFPVEVEQKQIPAGGDEDNVARGGGHLEGCTAAFVLRSTYSGTKRLGTAGHCTSGKTTDTYRNHPINSGLTGVSSLWSHRGSNGDLGYTSTGSFSSFPSFYWKYNDARYARYKANSPSNYPPGKTLCHYGKTTGATNNSYCASVWTRTASKTVDGVHYEKLTAMDQDVSAGGDSGGPWYWAETAYGVHSGDVGTATGSRSAFTPVHHFTWYGFEVWTL